MLSGMQRDKVGMMDSSAPVNISQFELLNPQLLHLSWCHPNHSELFTAGQATTGPSGSVNGERVEPYLALRGIVCAEATRILVSYRRDLS